MTRPPQLIGRVLYWLAWPGIWLVIRFTPPRTRVVIIADNKVLLAKDWLGTGAWSLPGGGLHRNEPAKTGAIREVSEETGIKLTADQLNSIGSFRVPSSGIPTHLIAFWASIKPVDFDTDTGFEIAERAWFRKSQLDDLKLTKATVTILEAFSSRQDLLR